MNRFPQGAFGIRVGCARNSFRGLSSGHGGRLATGWLRTGRSSRNAFGSPAISLRRSVGPNGSRPPTKTSVGTSDETGAVVEASAGATSHAPQTSWYGPFSKADVQ